MHELFLGGSLGLSTNSGIGLVGGFLALLSVPSRWLPQTDMGERVGVGRTEASAKDLKQQVEILAANYKEIAEVLRGV